ncbi:hypothetical protein PS1_037135 [Malus domestica]
MSILCSYMSSKLYSSTLIKMPCTCSWFFDENIFPYPFCFAVDQIAIIFQRNQASCETEDSRVEETRR